MNDDIYDSVYDLMDSEKLNAFSIVEKFCDECAKITPHHVDEAIAKSQEKSFDEEDDETVYENVQSPYECVYCRENDEASFE